jgi:hypothetical protein
MKTLLEYEDVTGISSVTMIFKKPINPPGF